MPLNEIILGDALKVLRDMQAGSIIRNTMDLNWPNLCTCDCPKCGQPLGGTSFFLQCSRSCGFSISRKRFDEMVSKMEGGSVDS